MPNKGARIDNVKGRIMVAPIASPAGEVVGRQMGILFPRLGGGLCRYGRKLSLLSNPFNHVSSRKDRKCQGSVYLKAV